MRPRTSLILCTTGAVLTFAVTSHPAVVDIQLTGVILMATGAIGLWALGGRAWLHLGRSRLRQLVDETARVQGIRVPLDDLMNGRRTARTAQRHVWASPAGHQQLMRVPPDPPEVTRDDEASEPAQAD